MQTLMQDLRYASRMLRRRPGFSTVAILAIALGIASTTAVFSVVNAVVLHSLPVAHVDRLVMLWHHDLSSGRDRITLSPAEFHEYARTLTAFDAMAAIRGISLTVRLGETPAAADAIQVTPNLFRTLGIAPLRGRVFSEQDADASSQVALISYELWQGTFGSDPAVLGQTLMVRAGFSGSQTTRRSIDGAYTVIGVLPRGLRLPYRAADVWIPLDLDAQESASGGLLVFGRLAPGVALLAASAEVTVASRQISARTAEQSRSVTPWLVTLFQEDVGDITPTLVLLAAAVLLLTLIVCANVGNMLLSRMAERQRELVVRRALGGSRARLVQQLLTESLVLSGTGTVIGVLSALWITQMLSVIGPATIPRVGDVSIDGRAVAAALATALVMCAGFAVAPLVKVARSSSSNPLALRAGSIPPVGRLREAQLAAEFALAFMVLVGAGLLVNSSRALENAPTQGRPSAASTVEAFPAVNHRAPAA